jgi:DinB superfamily
MVTDKPLREHLLELLQGEFAHISLEQAITDFPVDQINTRVDASPHTAWQLLEHIRLAQWDIIDFITNPAYKEHTFPDDYWPKDQGTAENWKNTVMKVLDDLQSMREMILHENTDLFAKIPHGSGQTILREALLIADHNAYHLGQIVLIKRMPESNK